MPNRIIRDGVLDSQRYHDVDKPARLAFLELLLCADDYGLVPLSDVYLKRHTTAFEAVSRTASDGILSSLIDVDLLRLYEVDGARYAFIPRFGNHPRASKPKWPLPPDAMGGNEIRDLAAKMQSRRTASAVQLRANAPETETETETGTGTDKSSPATPLPHARAPAAPAPSAAASAGAPEPAAAAYAAAPKAPRASKKCPSTFLVEGDLQRWARVEVPAVDIRAETASFRDHTFARAIVDWPGAWRNWMRKAAKDVRTAAPVASFRAQDTADKKRRLAAMTGGMLGGDSLDQQPGLPLSLDMEPLDHGPRSSDD